MRTYQFWIGWALCAAACALAARAEDDFPYHAYVAVDGAEVVSGPGQRYYATDRLALGAKIEVYREEASGWLAIRPPQGSFSWVDAAAIERDEEDEALGRVTEPTPAWIGTAAERVSEHRQHVTLKEGEVVKIIGEKQVASDEGEEETWLKISPPAGEFRWIHLRDVSRQRPEPIIVTQNISDETESTVRERDSSQEPRRIDVPRSAIALRDLKPPESRPDRRLFGGRPEADSHHVETTQFKSASEPATKETSSDGFVARKRRGNETPQASSAASEQLASRQNATFSRPRLDPPPLATPARSTTSTIGVSSGETVSLDGMARQLEQLDVDLSLMLAKDKSSWDLTGLRQQVEVLVERGNDPVARGKARLLLDKIQQFEQTFDADDIGPVAASAAAPAAGNDKATGRTSPADPRYDGEGWLKPVVSRRSEKPPAPYALVDADGKPLVFITPSPGLNLNRYVNKQVGVYGRRGYLESLKASHVTAERVIDLGRVMR
jgi:hypothetical protein